MQIMFVAHNEHTSISREKNWSCPTGYHSPCAFVTYTGTILPVFYVKVTNLIVMHAS